MPAVTTPRFSVGAEGVIKVPDHSLPPGMHPDQLAPDSKKICHAVDGAGRTLCGVGVGPDLQWPASDTFTHTDWATASFLRKCEGCTDEYSRLLAAE